MYARSQSFRSCSDASSQGSRRTRDSSSTTTGLESPTNTVSSFMGNSSNNNNNNNNNNGLFSLASPTSSSSSSSSSMPYRQPFRLDIPHHQQSLTSPQQQNLTSPVDASSHFMLPHTSHPEQQQTYAINDLSYNHPHHNNAMQQQQQQQQQQPSFSAFPSFSSPTNDITFNLDHHHPHSSTATTTSMSTATTVATAHDHHHHHRSSSSSIYSYYPHIKEEPIYDDRSYSTNSSSTTNYNNLPMIRTNDHSDNLPPMVTNTTEVNPVTATGFY
ncbi:unnamed protein product [Cunninghamella echinulata]